MRLQIPVASGVEASVKRQLKTLGYGECPALQGRVCLSGGWRDVARLNVWLRAGERVLLVMGSFPAPDFDALFEGVRALAWEEFFTPHTQILLDGKCVKSRLMAVKATGGVVKKAIVERLRDKLGVRTLDERGERAVVNVSLYEDRATIALDTSGDGLHRRGYRVRVWEAPLRETIAAAMVEGSLFRAGKRFCDPFCGSGTIPIEAALIMRNAAPGICRDFDFTRWKCAPRVLGEVREEARAARIGGDMPRLAASDLSPRAVELAQFHARRAGVERDIEFSCRDMRAFVSDEAYGVIVCNPPYGARLQADGLAALYRDFGIMYRALPDWNCRFLSAFKGAERAFGGRAAKKRRIANAHLACTLFDFFGRKPAAGCGYVKSVKE